MSKQTKTKSSLNLEYTTHTKPDEIKENRKQFAIDFKLKKRLKINGKMTILLNSVFNNIFDDDKILGKIEINQDRTNSYIFESIMMNNQASPYGEYADHIEVFETHDKKVVIFSSHYMGRNENHYEFLNKSGFVESEKKMFDEGVTIYKIFDKEEINQVRPKIMKRIKELKRQYKEEEKQEFKLLYPECFKPKKNTISQNI